MRNRDILILALFTFATVLAWLAADVYHAAITSQVTDVQKQLTTPLNPKFDTSTIDNIRKRKP